MKVSAMVAAMLRETTLEKARERSVHHIYRCLDANFLDDAIFWMKVRDRLDTIAESGELH